jgi:hypothetical protein
MSKKMSKKMVRTQVYLPRDIYKKLKQRADDEGITMATQIREALTQYVVETTTDEPQHILDADDPIWDLIGMAESGITDGATNHDKYIYGRDWRLMDEE